MADDKILVHAYTRSDGTQVREHYRNAPEGSMPDDGDDTTPQENQGAFGDLSGEDTQPSDIQPSNAQTGKDIGLLPEIQLPMPEEKVEGALQGYAKYDEPSAGQEQKPNPEPAKAQTEVSQTVTDAADAASELAKDAANVTPEQKTGLKQKLFGAISKLKQSHKELEQQEQELLNKLTTTKDQQEYSKALQDYSKLHEKNQKLKDNLARVNYYNENGSYGNLVEELDMLKQDFDTVRELNTRERPLKKMTIDNPNKELIHPEGNKWFVDIGTSGYNTIQGLKLSDANAMWNASSSDFAGSKNYVNKNGSLVYTINSLPSKEFQQIVRNTVKGATGENDSVGMIFNSNSHLSKQIAGSSEMKKLFLTNKEQLLNNKVVKEQRMYLGSKKNMALSLAHVYAPYTFINDKKELCSVIVDVYDFDQNAKERYVRAAAYAQDGGGARKYYSINVVKVPQKTWSNWSDEPPIIKNQTPKSERIPKGIVRASEMLNILLPEDRQIEVSKLKYKFNTKKP